MMVPAIVVIAYNRPDSLRLLLSFIDKAEYQDEVLLHISLDKSDCAEVAEIAQSFEWKFGEKKVVVSDEHLGLRQHVLNCGDLTQEYGSIIMLEDDLGVSSGYYYAAQQLLEAYEKENAIAGVSLYNYEVAESSGYPFEAISDGSDVYFMQVACSWGQAWTAAQWRSFRKWLSETGDDKLESLPQYIKDWGEHSWKKYFINYLIEEEKYFAYPRLSFSTNFEDHGTNSSSNSLYQVSLATSLVELRMKEFADTSIKYDAYFELKPASLDSQIDSLQDYNYEVDLYGVKPLGSISADYVLTTRKGDNPIHAFSSKLKPLMNNVIHQLPGKDIGFFPVENVQLNAPSGDLFYSTDIKRRVEDEKKNAIGLSVVIPIVDINEVKILQTLKSIPLDDNHVECLMVTNASRKEMLSAIIAGNEYKLKLVFCNEDDSSALIVRGLAEASKKVHTWLEPGSVLMKNIIPPLSMVFNVFGHINWICGIDEKIDSSSYQKINSAKYRWDLNLLNRRSKNGEIPSTELMFWRAEVSNKIREANTLKYEDWFAFLLGKEKLHVAVYPFGHIYSPMVASDFRPESAGLSWSKKILRKLSYGPYKRNKSPFRLVFAETAHLPDVLRYDFEHENFYTSRY